MRSSRETAPQVVPCGPGDHGSQNCRTGVGDTFPKRCRNPRELASGPESSSAVASLSKSTRWTLRAPSGASKFR
jgi:hypothetical protein